MRLETDIQDPFASFEVMLNEHKQNAGKMIDDAEALLCNLPESDTALRLEAAKIISGVCNIEVSSKLIHSAFTAFQERIRKLQNETARRVVTIDWNCPREADDIEKIKWALSTLRKVCGN